MVIEKLEKYDFEPDTMEFFPIYKKLLYSYFHQMIEIVCPMSFEKYPFDEHICHFTVISINELDDKLVLEDKTNYSKYSQEFHFEDTTYKVIRNEIGSIANYSAVGIKIEIKRSLTQIMASHYLPSALLVGISWLRL